MKKRVKSSMSRRRFIRGTASTLGAAAAGSVVLGASHFGRLVSAQSSVTLPKRLLIIHKPCGTVEENYMPKGTARSFSLSPILQPFAPLRSKMSILSGLDIPKQVKTNDENHGRGMVNMMTGDMAIRAPGFRYSVANRPSIDYILSGEPIVRGNTPIRSLELVADLRSEIDQIFTRIQSYSGFASPVAPEQRPSVAFRRTFGWLVDGGSTEENSKRLRAAWERQGSVLDYARGSLSRLKKRVSHEESRCLELHTESIFELERRLQAQEAMLDDVERWREENPDAEGGACAIPSGLDQSLRDIDPYALDTQHGEIGLAHLRLIKLAFQCDLTRVATFGWASGSSQVNFSKTIPGVESKTHHAITHFGRNRVADETAIHTWYNERLAEFLLEMDNTPDGEGSLLDNTLVVVWSEINRGIHTYDNVPIQIFGGLRGLHQGGRWIDFGGRSTNDLWLAVAQAFGKYMPGFGAREKYTSALTGIFSRSDIA